ncbi:MAG: hypothetical protein GXP31_17170 [Kiritimatiellaeota bacterium]|nr:hypothetical protein [Kiritimatiellota bacterium]
MSKNRCRRRGARTVVGTMLICGAVTAAGPGVSQAEFDALARRVKRLEELLSEQQGAIRRQQQTDNLKELSRLRVAPSRTERPATEGPATKQVMSGLENARFYFGATSILQGATGIDARLNTSGDSTDVSGSIDFEAEARAGANATVYAHIEAGTGAGLDATTPTLTGFNADAADDAALRLSELWYEYRFGGDRWALKVGKIDMAGICGLRESSFDANAAANDECTQFLSPALVNNVTVPFPDYTFGGELWVTLAQWLDVGIGGGDADVDATTGESVPDLNNISDDLFGILEVDLHTSIAGRKGNWRFYAWNHAADYPDVLDSGSTHRNAGWGCSFDHEISDSCSLFGRFGRQRESVAAVQQSWSAGLQMSAARFGRKDDVLGIGFVAALLGDDWEKAVTAAGSAPADEYHLEAYYNWQVNDALSLSPDFQWVRNPNGDRENGDIWVLALRLQLTY